MNRESLVAGAVPLIAIACCVAIPVVVSSGVGASVLVLGLGPPLALAAVVIAWFAVRRHRMG